MLRLTRRRNADPIAGDTDQVILDSALFGAVAYARHRLRTLANCSGVGVEPNGGLAGGAFPLRPIS